MTRLLFANTIGPLTEALSAGDPGRVKYLLFTCDMQAGKILQHLATCAQPAPTGPRSQYFQEQFVELVAELNRHNASRAWWALNFANKNPITTQLCDRVSQLCRIADAVEAGGVDTLVVVSGDMVLLRQVRLWAAGQDVSVDDISLQSPDAQNVLKRLLPVAVIAAFLRALRRRSVARRIFGPWERSAKSYNIIVSLLTKGSVTRNGEYSDSYFGPLAPFLHAQDRPLLNVLIATDGPYADLAARARDAAAPMRIVTLEYFLTFSDALWCLTRAVRRYFAPVRIKGPATVGNLDVRYLLETELKTDYRSGRYFDNLRVYRAISSLAKVCRVSRVLYPFENRAFEKMILLAMRESSRSARAIGYQHASLSLRHTNFLLGRDEAQVLPLPDRVLTMGPVTRDVMIDPGRFPPKLLEVGCALRQKPYDGPLKQQRPVKRVFVALATNVEEYVKVLRFLDAAFAESGPYEVWIRPHPAFSFDEALTIAGPPQFEYHKSDTETLAECMDAADVALYVHSTVGIEALARGIPAVCLDVPNVLNADPMRTFTDFKWTAHEPTELPDILCRIDGLDPEDYLRRQEAGVAFTRQCFEPLSDDAMQRFLDA